jgi:hypothetical protein
MFNEKLLADRRILVTGGGTGLGWRRAFSSWALMSIFAAGARASVMTPRPN